MTSRRPPMTDLDRKSEDGEVGWVEGGVIKIFSTAGALVVVTF